MNAALHPIALAGPTAAGKTAAALAFARLQPVEIISVDSALVYRGMDIGTAKPSAAEQAAVPHHLLDLLDPRDHYSAARFVADALRLVGEVQARGRRPMLVGGTMLYFKALTEGLNELPQADATLRAELDRRAAAEGWPALHAELARLDPPTAARLKPLDAQRIQRALEVVLASGKPMSAWHAAERGPTLALPMVSLEPAQRGWLHARIAQRFAAMLNAGFLAEVKALRARGDLHPDLPAMRCVGYRQAWEALDAAEQGRLTPAQFDEQLHATGVAATRQLAKRQLTWLRSMPQRVVVPCDAPDALVQALAALQTAAESVADAAC